MEVVVDEVVGYGAVWVVDKVEVGREPDWVIVSMSVTVIVVVTPLDRVRV
jgi:hypothetical protein